MARWKLMASHYLNVPDNEWEYQETINGKAARKRFPVPLLLNIQDQSHWNVKDGIIVCHEGKGMPEDQIFIGDPTPDMLPIDAEAKAISATFADKWKHPIDSLETTFSQSLLTNFEQQLAKLLKAATGDQSVSLNGVSKDDFEALKAQVVKLSQRNEELENAVMAAQAVQDVEAVKTESVRRV